MSIPLDNIEYLYAKFFKKIIRGKAVKNSTIDCTAVIYSGCQIVNSIIGKYSYCSYDCNLSNCEVGPFCSIAPEVVIGADEHPMDWVSTSPVFENVRNSGPGKRFSKFDINKPFQTIIGADVWIGRRAIIKAGISIGTGSVVGAGAIVTKNVDPYSIVAGNPAKILRKRFDDSIITRLLESKWWQLSDSDLARIAVYIKNPSRFIEELYNILPPPNNC